MGKPTPFIDRWDREDGPLGNGWRSGNDIFQHWWDPFELRNGSPVNICPDPGPIAQGGSPGARCAAYQDFGPDYGDNIEVGAWWNGKHQAPGFPIACINLDDADWGLAFCYEPDIGGGAYVLWAMGRRPCDIRAVKAVGGGDHKDGAPMYFGMRIRGDQVTCLADDRELLTCAIPPALVGSTIHGFGIDVNPVPGRPPNVQVLGGPFTLKPLNA